MLVLGGWCWPLACTAAPVYICAQPDGAVSETTILPRIDRHLALQRLTEAGIRVSPESCWDMDTADLPSNTRQDPLRLGDGISQRHRWRRGPGHTVIIDPTAMRPDLGAVQRYLDRTWSADRMAEILGTPLGDNLFRALRGGDLALARALVRQLAHRVSTPAEILTRDEVEQIRAAGRNYEADLD